jgi:ABC-2 type transport system ATP-binding protein
MNILELHAVKKYFTEQKAVDDISFNIQKGSIFGLLGPNGAGKTTLIRMITGIFYPDEGTIRFNGKLLDQGMHASGIGYMPEERGLYKKMKIGEQALYLAQLKGMSKQDASKRIKEWFEKLEMESWWNKRVEDLSKGMSQKLQFVTTVLHQPELIILDEPFSGLDPVNANLIKEEIFNLAKKGATIIFSTHRMEQVEEICEQIVLVNRGKKILDGSVSEIKQQFKENLYKIGCTKVPDHFDTSKFEITTQNNDHILIRMKTPGANNEILRAFIDNNIEVQSFQEVLPSLNDIFIRLVDGSTATRKFQNIN